MGNLAGGIAHDFNNILSPIIGFAELLAHDLPEDSPRHRHTVQILKASGRARDLAGQILTRPRETVPAWGCRWFMASFEPMGCITVDSEPGKETTVTFFLPVYHGRRAESRPEEDRMIGGNERILVVATILCSGVIVDADSPPSAGSPWDAFLGKPMSHRSLADAVRRLLDARERRRTDGSRHRLPARYDEQPDGQPSTQPPSLASS